MSERQDADARSAAQHLRANLTGAESVVLCGSRLAPYGDAFSQLDFLVLDPTAGVTTPLRPVRAGRLRYRYLIRPLQEFTAEVAAQADEALYLLRYGRVLDDPEGRAQALRDAAGAVAPAVWRAKAEAAYREFRRRRASLAWTLRRGQLLPAMDNVTQLLDRALAICCYVDGGPAPGRKWLFLMGLRTSAGSRVRPVVRELLAALAGLDVLGGSYAPRQNRLYMAAGRLQAAVEEEVTRRWRV